MNNLRTVLGGLVALVSTSIGWAGAPAAPVDALVPEEPALQSEVSFHSSYSFSAPFKFASQEVGRGDALRNRFEGRYSFPLQGAWSFRVGASYDRYDFGGTVTSFLPSTLQSVSVPIGLTYTRDGQIGFLAEIRPGLHFERDIASGEFDAPAILWGAIPIVEGKFYGVVGVGTSFLRSYPVIPLVGAYWLINDKTRLQLFLPEPRLVYDLTESVQIWLGGEMQGGTYKAGRSSDRRLSGQRVDYLDLRAGAGVTWSPSKHWNLTAASGYSMMRKFDYEQINKSYTSDPAPYIKLQFGASF